MTIKTPLLAVDMVIEIGDSIVLIERKNPPFGWALPGGFVDVGETVESAAIREAMEETSLEITGLKLLGVYSDPKRDDRNHVCSIVFSGKGTGNPEARDDAKNLKLFKMDEIPENLCFDHDKIISDYKKFKEKQNCMK